MGTVVIVSMKQLIVTTQCILEQCQSINTKLFDLILLEIELVTIATSII